MEFPKEELRKQKYKQDYRYELRDESENGPPKIFSEVLVDGKENFTRELDLSSYGIDPAVELLTWGLFSCNYVLGLLLEYLLCYILYNSKSCHL